MRGATCVIVQTHQILRLPRKMTVQNLKEICWNGWNVISNARPIRPWSESDPRMIRPCSDHETVSPQPASQPRFLCTPTASILYWKMQHFALRLSFQILPNTAPATKSDTSTSPNTAPATKSFCDWAMTWLSYDLQLDWAMTWLSSWLDWAHDLTELWLDWAMTWLSYDLTELWLDWAMTWLSYYLTELMTWLSSWLDWAMTWLSYDLTELWLDWAMTWLSYDLTELLLDWAMTWLSYDLTVLLSCDLIRISEVSQLNFLWQSTTPVLLCSTQYYNVLLQYYTVLQSSIHDWSLTHMNRHLHDWCPSHVKRHLQCAEQQESSSKFTRYCTCRAKWLWRLIRVTYETSFRMRGASKVNLEPHQTLRLPRKMNLMIDPRHIWNVI